MRKISSPWTFISLVAVITMVVTLIGLRGDSLRHWEKSDFLRRPLFQESNRDEEDDKYYSNSSESNANDGGEDDDYWEGVEEKEEEEGKLEERTGEKESVKAGTSKEEKKEGTTEEEAKEGKETKEDQPQETKKQKVILLWTGWRSGSTFLGELLKRVSSKTFYR